MEYLGLWGKMKISIPFKNTLRAPEQWESLCLLLLGSGYPSPLPRSSSESENQITSVISFNLRITTTIILSATCRDSVPSDERIILPLRCCSCESGQGHSLWSVRVLNTTKQVRTERGKELIFSPRIIGHCIQCLTTSFTSPDHPECIWPWVACFTYKRIKVQTRWTICQKSYTLQVIFLNFVGV